LSLSGVRWPILVTTVVMTLAVLFAGGYLLKTRTVDEPLESLLTKSPLVELHAIERPGDRRDISVTLKDTPDLERAYTTLDEGVRDILKGAPYALTIEDHRNPALEQTFRRVNLYVQEALVTGHFTDMAQLIEREAAQGGATARLSVDQDRIYLQLKAGDAYLYSVTDRPKPPAAQASEGGPSL